MPQWMKDALPFVQLASVLAVPFAMWLLRGSFAAGRLVEKVENPDATLGLRVVTNEQAIQRLERDLDAEHVARRELAERTSTNESAIALRLAVAESKLADMARRVANVERAQGLGGYQNGS